MLIVQRDSAPVVVLVIRGDLGLDDVDALRAFFAKRADSSGAYALVVDARAAATPSPTVRHALNKLMQEQGPDGDPRSICTAVLLSSQLLVGALTALLWFRPKRRAPLRSFASAADALPWVRDQATLHHVTLSPDVVDAVRALDVKASS